MRNMKKTLMVSFRARNWRIALECGFEGKLGAGDIELQTAAVRCCLPLRLTQTTTEYLMTKSTGYKQPLLVTMKLVAP
jgi:hypothetical protein